MALGVLGRLGSLFQTFGMERLLQRFTGRARAARDFTPAFKQIEADWYAHIREVFASEGAALGAPWSPLSEAYAAWKSVHYPGQPILQARGDLLASLTGGPGSVREERVNELILGSALKTDSGEVLAALHQYGTTRGLPARSFLDVSPEFVRSTQAALSVNLRSQDP